MNLIQFLMTPNEVLNNFLLCMFSFVQAYLFFKLFTQILNIHSSKLQKYVYICITATIGIIINFFINNNYSDILNILVFVLSVYFIFDEGLKKSLFALFISYISLFIASALIEMICIMIFHLSISDILNIPLYYFIANSTIFLILGIIYIALKRKQSILRYLKLTLNSSVLINLILGVLSITLQTYLLSVYADKLPFSLILVSCISLLLYFFISMFSLIRTHKLEKTTEDLETQKLYNKTLTHLHDNIRCFKHDFNNIVQAIGGYIALNDMNGLKDYYKNLLNDCKQTNNLNVLNPETINNPSIYSLLTNKYYLASENGVTMSFSIFTDLSNINFNMYEFTRILGILLDNAIEAARETEEKIVEIEFKSDSKKQLFIITNSFNDPNISTTKIFEKGYSTKEKNSGIGLWKVHTILSKNTNIDLFTTVRNNMFTQQLEVFF